MKHSVTLIIPTLNRSQFLKRALISVLNQTFVPEEIIVVDNGSNDKTYQMIGDSFKNIRYIYFEDKGVSKARNEGLKNANNELICFLDSDDEWSENYLEKMYELVKKNGLTFAPTRVYNGLMPSSTYPGFSSSRVNLIE